MVWRILVDNYNLSSERISSSSANPLDDKKTSSVEKRHSTGHPAILEENVDRIRQAFVCSPKEYKIGTGNSSIDCAETTQKEIAL